MKIFTTQGAQPGIDTSGHILPECYSDHSDTALQRQCTENSKLIFPEMKKNCVATSPIATFIFL